MNGKRSQFTLTPMAGGKVLAAGGMEQFALLNAVWAVTIVLLEVPSGALADRIGRKNMVVWALLPANTIKLCI